MRKQYVLYVSDQVNVVTGIVYQLSKVGYQLLHTSEYAKAYSIFQKKRPLLVIVDIDTNRENSILLIDYIKKYDFDFPIVTLSSNESFEKINGNYSNIYFLQKPLNRKKLIEYLNHIKNYSHEIFEFQNGLIYSKQLRSFLDKNQDIIKLHSKESALVELLLKDTNTYHKYPVLQKALGKDGEISVENLRTLVKSLRKKTYPEIIINLSGHGYKINLKKQTNQDEKINILICDDQKVNIEYLSILLSKYIQDIEIYKADGGKKAIEILKNNDIQVVLLDIEMPDVSGWDVARYVKEKLGEKNIAIIFITSVYFDEQFKQEGFDLGAVDYIEKPINQNLLINRLKLYIKTFNQERKILHYIQQSRVQEREILEKEALVAQSNLLEQIAMRWKEPLSKIEFFTLALASDIELNKDKKSLKKRCKEIIDITKDLTNTIKDYKNIVLFNKLESKNEL